jgi:hypothetical protein
MTVNSAIPSRIWSLVIAMIISPVFCIDLVGGFD